MIDISDYENIVNDLGNKLNAEVVTCVNDVKVNGVYISLKYIRSDSIKRSKNSMTAIFDLSIMARGANPITMINFLNLEFNLQDYLAREEEFNILSNEVNSGTKKLKYGIKDNDEEPEENEEENGNISYKKNYELQILFKR